jgi:hypothetical protein
MSTNKPLIPPPLWLSVENLKVLIEEVSGERARRHFRHLNLKGGYAPSPQHKEIVEYVRSQAESFGLENVEVEGFPSDGERFHGAFLTEPSWDARKGTLWEVKPRSRRLADFSVTPCALARYSRSTMLEADLIYVGEGTEPGDYEEKDVEGKIVLATGNMGVVHDEAVYKRGALGVVIFRTLDRFDHPDFIPAGQLMPWRGPDGSPAAFGFCLSYRQGMSLLSELEKGPVTVRVEIEAYLGAGEYLEVTGVIEGRESKEDEVLLTAHIDHRNTGGNNSTGAGVSMEVARTLSQLVSSGILPRPRRTIRFMWGPEHKGLVVYLNHHPEIIDSWLYVLDMDMVGKNQRMAGSRVHLHRSPHSNPTVVDDAVQEILEWVVRGNKALFETRALQAETGIPYLWPILDPIGSRDDFVAATLPFWGPSDHEDLNANTMRIHSSMLNDWPDPFLSVHEDNPETADPTQMKRIAVIGASFLWAMANAGVPEALELASVGSARSIERMSNKLKDGLTLIADSDGDSLPRNALEARLDLELTIDRELRGLKEIKPWLEGEKEAEEYVSTLIERLSQDGESLLSKLDEFHKQRSKELGVPESLADRTRGEIALKGRVPVRAEVPLGPVNLNRYRYGQSWLAKKLGNWDFLGLKIREDGYFVHYELLNFVDGKRDLLQIRDAVSAEFGQIRAEHVDEYFDLMEKAGVVFFKKK